MRFVMGVDESGTGAWAGPFTVCAYLALAEHDALLREIGARDSKQLTHKKRLELFEELALVSQCVGIAEVAPSFTDHRKAWRAGVVEAVQKAFKGAEDDAQQVAIKIDGVRDEALEAYFRRTWGATLEFVPHGDQSVPAISAASVLAKTRRTQLMQQAHLEYPMYGWGGDLGKGNDGYGTEAHRRAIEAHGVSPLHRRIRPLLRFFGEEGVPE